MENAVVLKAELACKAAATLGEGALWDPRVEKLLWVDIEKQVLHAFAPRSGKDDCWPMPARISTVVPVAEGGYLLALQTGIYYFNSQTGHLNLLVHLVKQPEIRFNDGKCDPAGRFWVGTIHMAGMPQAATLYRYDPDGALQPMLEGVTNSNGIAWTADGRTMYYIDTPTQSVQAFDFDVAGGQIAHRRVAVRIPAACGAPDGMTIDANDCIWVALYGGGAVHCYDPVRGSLLYRVEVPAPHTTSCAFGGTALKTLFITTARQELSNSELKQYSDSGSIFSVECPVAGVPPLYFGNRKNQ